MSVCPTNIAKFFSIDTIIALFCAAAVLFNDLFAKVLICTISPLCLFMSFRRCAGYAGWNNFLHSSQNTGKKGSTLFWDGGINSEDLEVGTRILIGWNPDRKCVIQYLGGGRFIALKTENATMKAGDTFTCGYMRNGYELHLEHFQRKDSSKEEFTYIAGLDGGPTILERL